ncbi:patched protein, partial [Plakobranchus ocellatus]
VTVMISFLVFLIIGAWGTAQVKDGLDLTDIVPKDTPEFDFLEAQSKYFGFYSINLVTKGDFDYAHNQQLLYQYHAAFNKVKKIIKREDGSLPSFWLDLFRQWLADLQRSFDRDLANGLVTQEDWSSEASEETILAFKLLSQTGDSDNPLNKDQVTRIRLVNEHGHIHPPAFYNYLTAWVTNDPIAYSSSMANLHPLPRYWLHDPNDKNFNILKSQHLEFAQLPFYLSNLSSTEEVIDVITEIRAICDEYNSKGLPNFPMGVPFTFYEQYIHLRYYLMVSLVAVLSVTFVVLTVVLMNPWTAFIVVLVLSMILVELFGFMGLMGIKLSAVPAVILIMAVGIGVEFTIHVAVGFITAIGSRNRRMALALEHTFSPVVHGAISTFLGILMLVGTEFDFIVKYFFNVLAALVVIGLFNGLMLLPVLLSVIGPRGEVIPKDNGDSLPMPTPEPSPQLTPRRPHSSRSHHHHNHHQQQHHYRSSSGRRVYPRANSDVSLSTISEEPTQYSSHEIVVQPEVVVETTTTVPGSCSHDGAHHQQQQQLTNPLRPSGSEGCSRAVGAAGRGSGGGGGAGAATSTVYTDDSSAPESPPPRPAAHVTRVKATATVKVEVHTPIPGSMNQEHSYKSKRRKPREDKSPCNSSGSESDHTGRSRTRRRQPDTLVITSEPGNSSSSSSSISYPKHKKAITASRDSQVSSTRRHRTSSSRKAVSPASHSSTICTVPCQLPQPVEEYEPHPLSPEPQWFDHPSPSPSQSLTNPPLSQQLSYPLYIHPTQPPPLPLNPPPARETQTSLALPPPLPTLPPAAVPGLAYPHPQPPSTPAPRQQHRRYSGGRAWDGSISVLTPSSRRNRRRARRQHQEEEDVDGSSEQDVSNV